MSPLTSKLETCSLLNHGMTYTLSQPMMEALSLYH